MVERVEFYSGPIVSRPDAMRTAETFYFTGRACSHGHVDKRYTSNGVCRTCLAARTPTTTSESKRRSDRKKWWENREENIEELRKYRAKHRAENPEYWAYASKKQKSYRILQFEKAAGRPRPNKCEICCEVGQICFDHSHAGGHFRGWLCGKCNSTLGMARDSASLLRKLADYLDNTEGGDHMARPVVVSG
jgi:Recombination endonuclease VII